MIDGVDRPRSDAEMLAPDSADLDRQLERSGIRTQAIFNRTFERLSELEAILLGLVDVLASRGLVDEGELSPAVQRIEEAIAARAEPRDHAVAIRPESSRPSRSEPIVDCAARLPVCKAVCCRLSVTLSAAEIESGGLRWDLGRPYQLRREADGQCTHLTRDTGGCGVYADRPRPCRQYTCATDSRIWSNFEKVELNHEWLDSHLRPDEPQLIEVQRLARPSAGLTRRSAGHPPAPFSADAAPATAHRRSRSDAQSRGGACRESRPRVEPGPGWPATTAPGTG